MPDSIGSRPEFRTARTFGRHDPSVLGMTTRVRTQTKAYGTLSSFQYSAFVPFGTPVFYGSQDSSVVASTLGPYGRESLERARLAGQDYGRGKGY
jgi:hypothetical protein